MSGVVMTPAIEAVAVALDSLAEAIEAAEVMAKL
jgi:hypothetical protein